MAEKRDYYEDFGVPKDADVSTLMKLPGRQGSRG